MTDDGYGAVLTRDWSSQLARSAHPIDGSPVYSMPGPAAGGTVLLLHGVGNTGAIYGPVMPLLASFGRVVAPTLSPAVLVGDRSVADEQAQVDAVTAMVDFLSEVAEPPWRIVGHSMGGVFAGLIMRIRPEVVSRAVLLNSPLPGVTRRIRRGDTLDRTGRALLALKAISQISSFGKPRLPKLLRGPELVIVRNALRGFVLDPGALDNRVISRAIMGTRTTDGNEFLRLARELPAWERAPFEDRPVEIVLGERDPLVPMRDLIEVRERYPSAKVHVLEQCAHFAHLEQPRATLDVIQAAFGRARRSRAS
jgi:pimeloyl-ACP methyl ester carboxylesterase